jgi:uncharacterized sulfatase
MVLVLAWCCFAALANGAPPNVVLIISDDHAWGDYSFMGHEQIRTPNLDKLAEESLTFKRGYVPSSLCCPSLASIITGLYPHQHKITSNDPPIPPGVAPGAFNGSPAFSAGREVMNRHLEAAPTLPRLLAKAGYASLQTGKWRQGDYRRGGFTYGMTRGERHGDDGLAIGRETMQPIYEFVDNAAAEETPFFVWYAPFLPHSPHKPPQRLLSKYEAAAPSPAIARHRAMVEWLDETVGDLLNHLDQQGLHENTIVVYVADNGWISNPETGAYAPKSKQSSYDGGVRTPIMIRWPGSIEPKMADELALSIDLAPTILAAIGQEPTEAMQGVDLLDENARQSREAIFGECFKHNAVDLDNPAANLRWRWMISGRWKLIVPTDQNEPDGVVELYDLLDDPHEVRNIAGDQAPRAQSMQSQLDAWWAGTLNQPPLNAAGAR